jgi:hypothetical protein
MKGIEVRTLAGTVALFAALLIGGKAMANEHQQWRMSEFTFTAREDYPNGFISPQFDAVFTAPDGSIYKVPGFWDGGKTWKVRFTPTMPGKWSYVTSCSNAEDSGLHNKKGDFSVKEAAGENPLYAHGGFLKVGENRRHLTYSDGTPFFWLGDTWWFCPSHLVPFEGSSNPEYPSMFKTLIDKRKTQGYTVVQMCFLGFMENEISKPELWKESVIERWQEADRYMAYANEAGIIPVIGLAFHRGLDSGSVEDWKRTWRYVVARLGSYSVTWFIVGELTGGPDKSAELLEARVEKVIALGVAIKEMDPYQRAMTVHPGHWTRDRHEIWFKGWLDFIMIQGGHRYWVPADVYMEAYKSEADKPVLEGECHYERIRSGKRLGTITEDEVRMTAYRAIQCGSFGYTYGAQGLWYPTQNEEDMKESKWGEVIPWWKAINLPGGDEMKHLRACYELVEWWKLEPRPDAVEQTPAPSEKLRILAKVDGERVFLVYFPIDLDADMEATLKLGDRATPYVGVWFNPRTGEKTAIAGAISLPGLLPSRPSSEDWIFILQKQKD